MGWTYRRNWIIGVKEYRLECKLGYHLLLPFLAGVITVVAGEHQWEGVLMERGGERILAS